MFRILLADGDLNHLVETLFTSYTVDVASNEEELLDLSYKHKYDLYISNYFYYNFFHELKSIGNTTAILFTDEYYDILHLKKAFSVGDDYLIKPLNLEELQIRVAYHYKKLYKHTQNIVSYRDMFFHISSKQLYKKSQKIKLSPSEAKLVELFLAFEDKPLLKDIIYDKLETQSEGTLRVYISKLGKIGFDISYERANLSYTLKS